MKPYCENQCPVCDRAKLVEAKHTVNERQHRQRVQKLLYSLEYGPPRYLQPLLDVVCVVMGHSSPCHPTCQGRPGTCKGPRTPTKVGLWVHVCTICQKKIGWRVENHVDYSWGEW